MKRKPESCVWSPYESDWGDNAFETSCGNANSSEFTLEEYGFLFCPWCGKRIKQEAAK